MIGAGVDVLSLATTFGLAGWFAGWIVLSERLGGRERMFLSLALSVPATLLAAAPAIATHSLTGWKVVAGVALLGGVASWRNAPAVRASLERLRDGRSSLRRPRPRPLPAALLVLAALGTWLTVLAPQGIEHTGDGRPNGTIVYYHWGIVSKVVDEGGLAPTLDEWGKPREFPYEYAFSVMHGAATASLAGNTGFVLEERYRIAMVLLGFIAVLALWGRWLPWWWAWLAAVLTMNVSRVETRLLVYKPEAFAFVLVVWSAWLLDIALERRSKRWGALAGVVLATSFLAHPVGSLLVAPLWGGILAGRALPELWRRHRLRRDQRTGTSKPDRKRSPAVSLRALVPAVLAFAVLFVGLRAVIGSTGQDLAQSAVNGVDKTRVIYNLAYVSADPFAQPRVPECSDLFAIYSTVRPFYSSNASWFFFDLSSLSSVLLVFGGLSALLGAFLLQRPPRLQRWPRPAKRAVITWTFYGCGVYLLALLICGYYSTWVPERVGPMRLMPYWGLVFPGLIVGVVWAAATTLSQLRRSPGRDGTARFAGQADWFGRRVAILPAVALTALATWTFTTVIASRDRGVPPFYIAEPRAGGLAESSHRAYGWIAEHLPQKSVILTNGYTEGALGMLSERTGLLDGRAPFAQPDPWRKEAISLLRQSRAFFLDPSATEVPGNATHVLVARAHVNLGGSFFPTDFPAFSGAENLEPIKRFDGLVLYRVRDRSIVRLGQSSARGLDVTKLPILKASTPVLQIEARRPGRPPVSRLGGQDEGAAAPRSC